MDSPSQQAQAPAGSHGRNGPLIVGIFVLAFIAIGLGAVAYLQTVPRPIAIADILADLREYDGRSVTVSGIVKETFNVLGVKWYRLEDDTASLMVVTQRGLPEEGSLQTVTGVVNQLYQLGPVKYTVLLEPLAAD